MPSKPLTMTQRSTLDFIVRFIAEHGYSPSYRVIATHFGISQSSAYERVTGLVDAGMIQPRGPIASRLALTEAGASDKGRCAVCGSVVKETVRGRVIKKT